MLRVTAIPVFEDNYIWLLRQAAQPFAMIVDPGTAQPVLDYLAQEQLQLVAICITHQHWDHIDGIADLIKAFPAVKIYVPAEPFKGQLLDGIAVTDQQKIDISELNIQLQVMAVPGHTLNHLAYLIQPQDQPAHLFCGDTLFSAGCGRLFEGSPEQMYHSLQRINQLAADTQIYCTHEYTSANLRFAAAVEPENPAVRQHQSYCKDLREKGIPTLPSTLARERLINPFLRCNEPQLQQHWQQPNALALFRFLRDWKNQF